MKLKCEICQKNGIPIGKLHTLSLVLDFVLNLLYFFPVIPSRSLHEMG